MLYQHMLDIWDLGYPVGIEIHERSPAKSSLLYLMKFWKKTPDLCMYNVHIQQLYIHPC